MDDKYKYELSETEIMERGKRQAVIDGRIDLRREEKKTTAAEYNAEIKALEQERRALSLSIREGYEWRDVAEQQELTLMEAICTTCFHTQRYRHGTLLGDKPCENCGLIGGMQEKKPE